MCYFKRNIFKQYNMLYRVIILKYYVNIKVNNIKFSFTPDLYSKYIKKIVDKQIYFYIVAFILYNKTMSIQYLTDL